MISVLVTSRTAHDLCDFPAGAARSCRGSLRLVPGRTLEITADEAAAAALAGVDLRVIGDPPADPPAAPAVGDLDPPAAVRSTPAASRSKKQRRAV